MADSDKPTFEDQKTDIDTDIPVNSPQTVPTEPITTDVEIPVSQVKNGSLLKKLKIKVIDDFTSRKFLILVIAVVAFFIDPKYFPADHLVMTFGIYAGANVLDKLVFWKGRR
jgi:hypothetical protein